MKSRSPGRKSSRNPEHSIPTAGGCNGLLIKSRRTHDSLIVRMSGELDLQTASLFRAEVERQLEASERIRHLILDLRGVTFIDSSGVGAILGRCRDIRGLRAGKVVVYRPRPPVLRVLQLAGLMRIVEVAHTQQQAMAIVKEGNPAS